MLSEPFFGPSHPEAAEPTEAIGSVGAKGGALRPRRARPQEPGKPPGAGEGPRARRSPDPGAAPEGSRPYPVRAVGIRAGAVRGSRGWASTPGTATGLRVPFPGEGQPLVCPQRVYRAVHKCTGTRRIILPSCRKRCSAGSGLPAAPPKRLLEGSSRWFLCAQRSLSPQPPPLLTGGKPRTSSSSAPGPEPRAGRGEGGEGEGWDGPAPPPPPPAPAARPGRHRG